MTNPSKQVLFSGIQPSGALTLGNYIGAIKNWAQLQHDYSCLFSLVDLHTITVRQDPKILRENCYDALAINLACGLRPESPIFCQSHVPQHSELAWILNCFAYVGELGRMTQFKDKSKKYEANINAGLFTYPALMAADILLYKTNLVPVGEDQTQHVEIARDIAIRFNNIYGKIFAIPEICKPKIGARIMSLLDPAKKMSKSDENSNNVIFLLDSPDQIMGKFKRAVTDSEKEVRFDVANKPGVANLLTIHAVISGKSIAELESEYRDQGYGKLKGDTAAVVVEFLTPVQKRFRELRADITYLNSVLRSGADCALALAEPMLRKVHEVLGFIAK
jgi:tryptophanyl-tRNA synthetase